jgi:maltose-binding protein MalE
MQAAERIASEVPMRSKVLFLVIPLLFAAGCGTPVETPEKRIVHKGEPARLHHGKAEKVVLAVAHEDAHALAAAVDDQRQSEIDSMVSAGKAFEADAGTPVTVVSESYNERRVEVMDGPHKGKSGWVPFEWLKR